MIKLILRDKQEHKKLCLYTSENLQWFSLDIILQTRCNTMVHNVVFFILKTPQTVDKLYIYLYSRWSSTGLDNLTTRGHLTTEDKLKAALEKTS